MEPSGVTRASRRWISSSKWSTIPVSDVDRSKEFYVGLGWRHDVISLSQWFRVVQFTPSGSGCSVQFGTNRTSAARGPPRARS